MAAPLLRVTHLAACYGDAQALWDVSLEACPGELVVMVGANGAGKTTTLRAISGLIRSAGGGIEFKGESIRDASSSRIVEMGIGHVPEGRALFPHMSIRDNLELGAYRPGPRRRRRPNLERVFSLFPKLKERERQVAGTLSGGEQQMCAIGRGLMAAPTLLLIDELSLGLAPRAVELLIERLRAINKSGVAVLLVEQDVMNALELADRAYVIDHGRMVKSAAAAGLVNDPAIREAYMGLA